MFFVHYISNGGRVYRTAACSHKAAFKRGKSHGSVNADAVFNGAERRTVAEVKRYKTQFFGLFAEELRGTAGNEFVARAVKTVTSYFILFVIFFRKTVAISISGHGLMKTRVEYRDLRNARHYFFARFDAFQVCGIMKRSERNAFSYRVLYRICYEH